MTRFYILDAMRASMIMIVFYHALEGGHVNELVNNSGFMLRILFENANCAVAIFFVISGFVINHNLWYHPSTVAGAARFLRKRFIRLSVPYYAAIALNLLAIYISHHVAGEGNKNNISLGQLTSHLIYIQDILGYRFIDAVYWTLCLEFQFYIGFVIIVTIGGGGIGVPSAGLTRFFIGVIGPTTILWPLGVISTSPKGVLLPEAYEFMLGVFAHWSIHSKMIYTIFFPVSSVLSLAFGCRDDILGAVAAAFACLLSILGRRGLLEKGRELRPLLFLGKISYSAYLTHNLVTGVVFRISRFMAQKSSYWADCFWMCITFCAVVCFSYLYYAAVERPSSKWAGALSSPDNDRK